MIKFEERINVLKKVMEKQDIGAFFLPPSGEQEYITGIRRQRPNATHTHMPGDWLYGTLITPSQVVMIAPKMAARFAKSQIRNKSFITEEIILEDNRDYYEYAQQIFSQFKLTDKKIAFPKKAMAFTLVKLQELFPQISFTSATDIIDEMRMIKEKQEIATMRKAAEITDAVFLEVIKKIKVGMTEEEIAAEVDWQIVQQGGEGTSFITGIMCQGASTAKGYKEGINRTTKTKLELGQTLAFDFGLVYDGFVSDFGRTVYIGEPTQEARQIHQLVMDAQQVAINAMIGGKITAGEVDRSARSIINEAGYGEGFFHRLGHGIGIDVHEAPFLTFSDNTLLQNGMTFTVEPSVMVPNKCWIRVEDVVVVTDKGGDCLNKVTKEIIVID